LLLLLLFPYKPITIIDVYEEKKRN